MYKSTIILLILAATTFSFNLKGGNTPCANPCRKPGSEEYWSTGPDGTKYVVCTLPCKEGWTPIPGGQSSRESCRDPQGKVWSNLWSNDCPAKNVSRFLRSL